MKIITVKQMSEEIGVEEDILLRELHEVLKGIKDNKLRLITGHGEAMKIVIIDQGDVDFIKNNSERGPVFLADHFNLEVDTTVDIIEQLKHRKIITTGTYNLIMEVKEKPSIKAWFEPDIITTGESASLYVEVYTPETIDNPEISLHVSPHLELIQKPKTPNKLLVGKFMQKYLLKAEKHGEHDISVVLSGLMKGRRVSQVKSEASLRVKPQPPEIEAELLTAQEVSAVFNREFSINLQIRNIGRGDCFNMSLTGLDNYKDFSVVTGAVVGNLASGGVLKHVMRLRPRKSGRFVLEKLSLSYQDAEGNVEIKPLPLIIVEVKTPQPELKIELVPPPTKIKEKQVFTLVGRIVNLGKGEARNIITKIPVPYELLISGHPELHINQLGAGSSEEFEFTLRAPSENELKIGRFKVLFEDEEGNKFAEECPGTSIPISLEEHIPTIVEKTWCFTPGAVIRNKYRIIKEVGEGGFAKVYLAEHLHLKREVALKALKPAFIRDPEKVERFISEVKVTMDLREPNIIAVYDVDIEDYEGGRYPFMVMEYLPDGTLNDRLIARQPSPLNEVISVLKDVCEALLSAHQCKLVHCDIKPSNLFYDKKKGLWKLGDFGLSTVMRGKEAESTGGSLAYMAPEVREGKKVTEKSDIYSLGVVMREMLTGKVAGDLSKVKVTYKGLDESLLQEFAELVERMTSPDPDKRPGLIEVYRFVRTLRSITFQEKKT